MNAPLNTGALEAPGCSLEISRHTSGSARVSVIMPVYNAAATVGRAVQSALEQTLSGLEVIAYDDASKDGSRLVLEDLAKTDPRLAVLAGGANRGPGGARNRALDAATGDWVAILDADDWYAPERLQTLLELGEATGADFVCDNQFLYDAGAGAVLRTGLTAKDAFRPLSLDDFLRNSLTGLAPYDYGLLQPVIRREFLQRHSIRYIEECRYGEDFLLVLDCLAAGAKGIISLKPMYYVTQPYGIRSGTMSHPDRAAYDYSVMRRFTDEAVNRYQGRLTNRQIRLLQRRSAAIELYSNYVLLTSGGPARPWRLASAACRAGLWPHLIRSAARRLARLWAQAPKRSVG